jgi:hypothetical protein
MGQMSSRTVPRAGAAAAMAGLLVGTALFLGPTEAAAPTWVEGPGTVPEDVLDRAMGWAGLLGPTDAIELQGATTVGALGTQQPHIAEAVFQSDPPDEPVYVVFAHGQYHREYPGQLPFDGELAMLVLDKSGSVRASTFYRRGQEPVISNETQPFDPSFDIQTLLPQSG